MGTQLFTAERGTAAPSFLPMSIVAKWSPISATAEHLLVFGRPFVKQFALYYRSVVCLSVCLSVLTLTLVYCGQTAGQIKMKLGMQVGLCPGLGLGRF